MTSNDILQLILYFGVLLLLAKPLGVYMARVYEGRPSGLDRALGPVERLFYRMCGIKPDEEMSWKKYAGAVLIFSAAGFFFLYFLQRAQDWLPLNPQKLPAVSPDSSFNTAVSFVTNTNWQGYGGETTMSYLTQMAGLGVQNFVSAAAGMAVLIALIRGFKRNSADTIGNFWVDLTRSTLYILLPLSFIWSLLLASQGVVQTFSEYKTVSLTQPITYEAPSPTPPTGGGVALSETHNSPASRGKTITSQAIPLGPAASQIAIKQLGTNGGGFFIKGADDVSAMKTEVKKGLDRYVQYMRCHGYYASAYSSFGNDVVDEVARLTPEILERFPNAILFGGQLVFPKTTFFSGLFHNYTIFAVQRRFYNQGIPVVILPIRV